VGVRGHWRVIRLLLLRPVVMGDVSLKVGQSELGKELTSAVNRAEFPGLPE